MCRKLSCLAAVLALALLSACGHTEGHYTPPSSSPAPATQAVPTQTPEPTPEPTPTQYVDLPVPDSTMPPWLENPTEG